MLPGYLGGWQPPATLGTVPGKVPCTLNLRQLSYFSTADVLGDGACPFGCCWLCKCWNVGVSPGALNMVQSWRGGGWVGGGAVTKVQAS